MNAIQIMDVRERLLALEESRGDPQEIMALSRRLWESLMAAGDISFILMAEQVHRLRTAQVVNADGVLVRKYQLWCDDWTEFCLRHLQMPPTEASDLKRIWEVYVVKCGFDEERLLRAGRSKLRVALARVDRSWPDCQELLDALFGRDNICNACGAYVAEPGEFCPSCGAEFEPVPPATFSEVLAICQRLREEERGDAEEEAIETLDLSLEYIGRKRAQVLAIATVGNRRFALPPWEISSSVQEEVSPGVFREVELGREEFFAIYAMLESIVH